MDGLDDDKFIVIPKETMERLSMTARGQLGYMMSQINTMREKDAGGPVPSPRYYVVNQDEPYADEVLNTILLGEKRKERSK